MNQKEAFFDTNHVMQDSDKEDGFVVAEASSSNGMWLRLFSRLDQEGKSEVYYRVHGCLLYTSPSPRDGLLSRMPSSA